MNVFMSNKFLFIDTEYNKSNERIMNVVCCSVLVDGVSHNFWINGDKKEAIKLSTFLLERRSTHIFVAFAAEAECSAIYSLGIDPTQFKWVDLHLEVKMLYNHNYALTLGKHLINGKVKYLSMFDEKPKTNLASSLYKFCGIIIDSEHKAKMRDLIISNPTEFALEDQKAIMDYCESDVKHLPLLFKKIKEALERFIPKSNQKTLPSEILLRGDYSARTAIMTRIGLPINMEWANNLAANVPIVLTECIQDINSQFDIKPFKFDKKTSKYVMDTKVLRAWIEGQKFSKWLKTDKLQYSLALEAWEDHFNFRHDFPRGNLGAQMVRYLKMKQSLNSFNFKENQKTETFFDSIGSDGYSRSYFNHYGAQSSRSQPKSSGFLFLKSAWMRVLAQPPKGYAMGGIDYSSQEFLLSAVCSGDKKMIQAYADGDVYLYYGKGIGLIPKDGTKETHGKERDLCKATVLGLSYLMTKVGLSKKLTADTGRYVSEEEAQRLVDAFNELFSTFSSWRESVIHHYYGNKNIKLPDGWYMFGDNPSERSAANMPLQGAGACIMRKAVSLAQDAGLQINLTLHDALYIISKKENILDDMDTLRDCMKEAFCFYFKDKAKEAASLIRLDGKVWGIGFNDGQVITNKGFKVESSELHIDKRAKKEYDMFNKFFTESPALNEL